MSNRDNAICLIKIYLRHMDMIVDDVNDLNEYVKNAFENGLVKEHELTKFCEIKCHGNKKWNPCF